MADVASKTAQIRQAVLGKDVIESIAQGIEAINAQVETTTASEQARVDAENSRVSAEEYRVSAENRRQDTFEGNEANRENTFDANETTRQSTFDTNENARKNTFDTNEASRQTGETARSTAETGRVNAENARVSEFTQIKADYNTASNFNVVTYDDWSFTATEDTNVFTIDMGIFNPVLDIPEISQDGALLNEGDNYTRVGAEVTLSYTLLAGEKIDVRVFKGVINTPPSADGSNMMDGSITKVKLSADMQDKFLKTVKAVDFTGESVTVNNDIHPLVQEQLDLKADKSDILYIKPSGSDDTQAIQNKINGMISGQTLRFLKGTYIITGATSLTCNKNIKLEFEPGAIIDASGCTATAVFSFSGSYGTFYNIGANASLGDTSITVDPALASTLSTGDLIFITTASSRGGNNKLWSAAKDYYYKGEVVKVESISGNTISLAVPLYDSYSRFDTNGTTPETMVGKINPITVISDGMTLKSSKTNPQDGLLILYGENCKIINSKISGAVNGCIALTYVYNFEIKGNRCTDYMSTSGYGINIASCQDGVIENNYCVGGRHGITHGGYEPCRNIVVKNNTCHTQSGDTNAGIDTHHNLEFFLIEGNLTSGIWTSGRNIKIVNNTIIQPSNVTIAGISFYAVKDCEYVIISGNTITTDEITGTKSGIRFSHSLVNSNITINRVIIDKNIIQTVNEAILINSNYDGLVINSIDIINNEFYCVSGVGISIDEAVGTLITHMLVHNIRIMNNYASCPILCVQISAIYSLVLDIVKVNANVFEVRNATRAPLKIKNTSYLDVIDNYLACTNASAGTYNELYASIIAMIKNNKFVNLTFSGVSGTIAKAIISDNIYQNTTMNYGAITGQKIMGVTPTGNYITYGTASPTTGTWSVGDRCVNSSPVVGQPKAWICTVAGTPGTWVSEGNL